MQTQLKMLEFTSAFPESDFKRARKEGGKSKVSRRPVLSELLGLLAEPWCSHLAASLLHIPHPEPLSGSCLELGLTMNGWGRAGTFILRVPCAAR